MTDPAEDPTDNEALWLLVIASAILTPFKWVFWSFPHWVWSKLSGHSQ